MRNSFVAVAFGHFHFSFHVFSCPRVFDCIAFSVYLSLCPFLFLRRRGLVDLYFNCRGLKVV